MQITLLQRDIVWADAEANRRSAEQAIKDAPRSDLYVLPEMFATGFATEPQGVAESDGATLGWMRRMARETDAAVAATVATEEGGRFYNRFHFVTPEAAEHYDKRHLFTYGGENRHYTAGTERKVVEWRGARFLLQVCYDLRFPCFSRNNLDYDVALYAASWPASRRAVWDCLLRARAIENQCYVCGVNRVGEDLVCRYDGGTVAIDAYGKTVAQCPDNEPSALTFSPDLPKLNAFRRKFPALMDRD